MRLVVRSLGDTRLLHVEQEFDWSDAAEVRREIFASARAKHRVIVSLERCSFCDTAAVTLLHTAKAQLGERFTLVIPAGHSARRIAGVLAWTGFLHPLETLGEALIRLAV